MSNLTILLLLTFLLNLLTGCGGGGRTPTSNTNDGLPDNPSPVTTPVTIQTKYGIGFECMEYSGTVWCVGNNAHIGINTTTPVQLFTGDITSWHVRNNTVCVESVVTTRPYSRTQGTATYCIGISSLVYPYNQYLIVYSGPPYSHATHGSVDVTYHTIPYMAGDITLHTLLHQTAYAGDMLTDGVGLSGTGTIDCESGDGILVCPAFSIEY